MVRLAIVGAGMMGSRLPYMEHQGEPLLLEQRHFLECVLAHTQPTVSGRDGLAALDTAIRIRDQATCMQ